METIYGVGAVGLVVALVELAKQTGFDARYGGVLAAALGVGLSVGYTLYGGTDVFEAVVVGLAIGLSAAGLYSTTKNATE